MVAQVGGLHPINALHRKDVVIYSRGFVATEIGREAQPLRQEDESRDWRHYAREVSYYAFGPAGDIDIGTFGPTPEKILRFHQEAEKLETEREATRLRMR